MHPLCPECNKPVKFLNRLAKPFSEFCSDSCAKRYRAKLKNNFNYKKIKENLNKKYGVDNVFQLNEIKEKSKNTKFKKYNNCNFNNSNKIKLSLKNYFLNLDKKDKERIKSNRIKSINKKYGVDNVFQLNDIKEKSKNTLLNKYGVINPGQSIELMKNKQQKEYLTKKKNNSFNISKQEDECYNILKEKYPDIVRQYKSDKYPFACDFYIPSLDLYIEYNGSWTHGNKPFENTKEDNIKLEYWKSKNTKYYNNAIQTWTIRDPQKRKIAKENNLNYLEIWNLNQIFLINLTGS